MEKAASLLDIYLKKMAIHTMGCLMGKLKRIIT